MLGQGSWLDVQVQTDQYAGETSWEILNEDSEVVAVSPPYQNNTLQNHMVFLPSGDYEFVMMDAFGDGICCSFGDGWYRISNNCGLDTANYEFSAATDTIPFALTPCIPPLPGCTNPIANNYNPWANIDNGSCNVFECDSTETLVSMDLTLDTWPGETGFTLVNIADGQPYEQVIPGEFDFGDQLVTYTYNFCVSLGFELILVDEFGDGLNGYASGGQDGACVITACDSVLWELEDLAFTTFDDGNTMYSGPIFPDLCPPEPPVYGCMDDDYVDYNPEATLPDTCETLHTWGCTDPEALNYDSTATISDLVGPCSIHIILEDDAADGWGNSTIGMVQGEQQWMFTVGPGEFFQSWDIMLDSDEEVDIYYFQAGNQQQSSQELAFQTLHNSVHILNESGDTLLSEGSNPFINNGQGALQPFTGPNWTVYHFTPFCGDGCIPYIYGCTDEEACNYDAEANTNSECSYPVQYYDCSNACVNDDDSDGVCNELEVVGCQDPAAFNYNSLATDAGDCIPVIFGCTDPTQFNYDPEANTENGGCIPFVYGCMNPYAFNYNPDANTELEDSCIEVLVDCMDPDAFNYNELANTPDEELCLYDAGCITGPGNPYWLNNGCYAWIIDIDPYCCEVEWDDTCVELYSYCEQGWPQGVYDVHSVYGIYPNPTSEVLNVRAPEGTLTSVYNITGQLVVAGTLNKTVDLSHLPKGVYKVVMQYNKRIINKKIIKS
tara:strand:+ start:4371 stop:6536 length:2166 start_codon:yes stop_codon:yes gene_type:complete